MSPDPQRSSRFEAVQLRIQLDALERRIGAEIDALRARIAMLESPSAAAAGESLPEPRASVEPEPVRAVDPPAPVAPAVVAIESVPPAVVPEPVELKIDAVARVVPQPGEMPLPEREVDGSFEMRFGRVWLVRIGIALLLTGLVLLGNFAYQNWIRELPAGVRLAALYACALTLTETGRRLARRGNLERFGEVVVAGGLSFFYYCTFAAHHVERLRVIESPVLAGLLLGLAAAGVAGVSWFRQAKGTAILGLLLASYATMLQPVGWLSCVSNLVLAAAGCFFMTRPGWSGPGWVSMLAGYVAFFGWQLLGAAGSGHPASALWFLPATWALFAVPCLLGRFRASMTERAKCWFTGANNALFFLFFSGLWLTHHGDGRYWLVVAVMGAAFVFCGVLGRKRSETSAGVFMVQGLACASLAIILKLDGYHLALALAGESLALALAFRRFGGRSELAFSTAAGLAAAVMILGNHSPGGEIPLWSAALGAVAVLAASGVLLLGSEACRSATAGFARGASTLVFGAALASGLGGWCLRLDAPWPMPAAMGISLGLSAASLGIDRSRRWIELPWGALVALGAACCLMLWCDVPWAFGATGLMGLAGLWIWQHRNPGAANPQALHDLAGQSAIPIWLHAATVPAALGGAIHWLDLPVVGEALWIAGGGLALVAAGLCLRLPALVPAASLLGLPALILLASRGDNSAAPWFGLVALQLAALVLVVLPRSRALLGRPLLAATGAFTRVTLAAAWCAGWIARSPGHWVDWLALTALALAMVSHQLTRRLIAETVVFLAIAIIWGLAVAMQEPWTEIPGPHGWRGWAVILTTLHLALTASGRRSLSDDAATRRQAVAFIGWVACVGTALWVTQMVVWRMGWKPSAVVWTVLGFAAVSTGLWRRLQVFRLAGFGLLGMAVLRVFTVDVWDFNAFMRVVSFIVLGLALMLLGLFYHRFAPLLKQWLEADRATERGP